MNFAYGTRLVCLCLEIVFLVNLAASTIVLGLSRPAARAAIAMRPRQAAKLFFCLRLLPFVLSLCVAVSLCIPSYLRYEQNLGSERLGLFCMVTAVLGLVTCLISASRGLRALAQSYFIRKQCRLLLHAQSSLAGEADACFDEEDGAGLPLLALVGILRPRLIVARHLVETLSAEQLEAALRHEQAHRVSWDNLKRLLLVLAPDIFPFMRGFAAIKRQWERYTELAADDYAACGRIDRSVALAEALIQVARLGNIKGRTSLTSSLSAGDLDLAMRVDRLLANDSTAPLGEPNRKFFWNSSLVLAACATFLMLRPETLYPLYKLLEFLLQ